MDAGLIDIGDIISTVNGESVKGLELSAVVSKIVGASGSRVQLELLRPKEMCGTPPAPVMTGPFKRLEVQVKRLGNKHDPKAPAGLGILFHKV